MAKKKNVQSTPAVAGTPKGLERKLRRLGKGLATTQELEAKRTRQLDKARQRGATLQAAIMTLRGASDEMVATGPQAYCMREKRSVVIANPVAIVMRNGRSALSGTCPSCGVRVVTTARGAVAPTTGDGAAPV
jgi:hypothetical protein